MADYAPHYTPRYRMRYRVLGQVHTATIRFPRGSTTVSSEGAAFFTDLLDVFGLRLMSDFSILGADVALTDSNVFLPAANLPVLNDTSAAAGDESYKPVYVSFVGRSIAGHRAVMFLYGLAFSPNSAENTANDYRIQSTEDNAVLQAVSVFNGVTGIDLVANDNNDVVWYPYVNVGFNAYYQKKARRG